MKKRIGFHRDRKIPRVPCLECGHPEADHTADDKGECLDCNECIGYRDVE